MTPLDHQPSTGERSYLEEIALAGGRVETAWEPQRIDAAWCADVARGDGSCKAILLRDAPLVDGVLYAEHKRRRFARPRYVTRARKTRRPTWPETIPLDTGSAPGPQMYHEFVRFHGVRVETTKDGITADEIRLGMQSSAKRCLKHLDEDAVGILVEYFRSIMIKPEIEGLSWIDADDPEWGAFAEVRREDEDRVVDALRRAGAELADNEFEVQEYPSVHVISPGRRWLLELHDVHVSYVPHGPVGSRTVEEWAHRVDVELPSLDEMREASLHASGRRVFTAEDLMLVTTTSAGDDDVPVTAQHVEVVRWMRSKRRKVLSSGGEWKRRDEAGRHVREVGSPVDDAAVAAHPHEWVSVGEGRWMRKKNYLELKSKLDAYAGLVAKSDRLRLRWASESPHVPAARSSRAIAEWFAEAAETSLLAMDAMIDGVEPPPTLRDPDSLVAADVEWGRLVGSLEREIRRLGLPRTIKGIVLDGDRIAEAASHSIAWETREEPIVHDAPFSERGGLRLWNAEPAVAVEVLQELGIVGELEPEVPVDLLWPARTRLGRIRPVHPDYLSGDVRLEVPEDHMVLHGMTGASDAASALGRLESMVRTGGLKCIAERRRAGVGVVSMSPRGDIASGIDGGVPCKIGRAPHYGSLVIFGMRPEVLHRKELFFAPCDYGGGKNRYAHFTKYAESIGQRRIWLPPTHETRQHHLATGIANDDNEVYIRHEIVWEEIDTVWVETSLYDAARARWDEWIAVGILPADVRLEAYSNDAGDLPGLISARARALATHPERSVAKTTPA